MFASGNSLGLRSHSRHEERTDEALARSRPPTPDIRDPGLGSGVGLVFDRLACLPLLCATLVAEYLGSDHTFQRCVAPQGMDVHLAWTHDARPARRWVHRE